MTEQGLDNSRAAGWFAEWHWLPFTLLVSIRSCLVSSEQGLRTGRYTLFLQPKRQQKGQRLSFADFEVQEKESASKSKLFLRGEYKLTRIDAVKHLRDALDQVLSPVSSRPGHVLVIVGVYDKEITRLSIDRIQSVMQEKSVEDIAVTPIPGLAGCRAYGKVAATDADGKIVSTRVEVFISDVDGLYDFFATTLLTQPHSPKSAEKLGALAEEVLRPATAHRMMLGEILKSGGGIELNLPSKMWQGLPVEPGVLFDLLHNPLEKLLYDFSRMSVANHEHDRWTHTLLRLSGLDSSAAALEHALHPLPPHLPHEHRRAGEEVLLTSDLPVNADSVRIVIESRAGAGKTTMLWFMKWLKTQDLYHHRGLSHDVVIPFLLDLQSDSLPAGPGKLFPLLLADRPLGFTDRSNVFTDGLANAALEAVLSLWRIDLFVDGYDHLRQIVADYHNSLNSIGEALYDEQVQIRRLIITSRPGHQADRLWPKLRFESRKISNAGIDQHAVDEYIKSWWTIVASVDAERYGKCFKIGAPVRLVVEEFTKYLESTGKQFEAIIRSTPLLLAIAMATFLQEERKPLGKNESALFENLFGIKGRQKMDVPHLEQLSFALMMAPYSVLGVFTNSSNVVIDGREMLVEDWGQSWRTAAPWEECAVIDSQTEGQNQKWTYLHPSFEEFLACRYFVEKSEPSNGGGLIPGPNQQPVAPAEVVTRDGFIGNAFSEVFTRLGNQALKFILGRVLLHREKLEALLDWLAVDFGLQQYLYDTECLRPAERELHACRDEIRGKPERIGAARREALLWKLLGHMHYSSFGDGRSQEALNKAIAFCVDDKFQDNEWYQLFCYDHIQNRTTEEVQSTNAERFIKLLGEMKAAETDFLLRRAHFAGHLGNQALREIDSSPGLQLDKLTDRIEQGEEQYTVALKLRAIAFAECVSPDGPDSEAMRTMLTARDRLLQTSNQELPPRREHDDADSVGRGKERFMGPCQAIGDFANQLAGRSAIRLWKALEQQKLRTGAHENWTASAEKDLLLAREYWELANDRKVRAVRGERITKYVIYLAGVNARKKILSDRRPWAEHHNELLAEMARLSEEFKISMPEKRDSRDIVPGVERFFHEVRATFPG